MHQHLSWRGEVLLNFLWPRLKEQHWQQCRYGNTADVFELCLSFSNHFRVIVNSNICSLSSKCSSTSHSVNVEPKVSQHPQMVASHHPKKITVFWMVMLLVSYYQTPIKGCAKICLCKCFQTADGDTPTWSLFPRWWCSYAGPRTTYAQPMLCSNQPNGAAAMISSSMKGSLHFFSKLGESCWQISHITAGMLFSLSRE